MKSNNKWKNKTILITGVCGTVGKETLSQVIELQPSNIIGIDNNEGELFYLAEEYKHDDSIQLRLGDIRDLDRLTNIFSGVDIVLHTAALKHVPLCEETPVEPVRTNILGTQNVIDAAIKNKVERVLLTSTDKAVNPTNVMGASKLMSERLMIAAGERKDLKTIFAVTRFGNVLGSRGSVIPLFKKQIESGKNVTLTDESMTRFIMTLKQSVQLVLDSVFLATGGEIFVTKMPTIRISDLAQALVDILSDGKVGIDIVGVRKGEKVFEELINEEEVRRSLELENYYVVRSVFSKKLTNAKEIYPELVHESIELPYSSKNSEKMSIDNLKEYLIKNNLV